MLNSNLCISIVTKLAHQMQRHTMNSLKEYAGAACVQYDIGGEVDWVNNTIGSFRLEAHKKIKHEYIFWLDSDDKLINPFPDIDDYLDYDVFFFPYIDECDQYMCLFKNPSYRSASTPRIIARTDYMVEWLEEFEASELIREDCFILSKIFEGCINKELKVKFFPYPLVHKRGARCGSSSVFNEVGSREIANVWVPFFHRKLRSRFNRILIDNEAAKTELPKNVFIPNKGK